MRNARGRRSAGRLAGVVVLTLLGPGRFVSAARGGEACRGRDPEKSGGVRAEAIGYRVGAPWDEKALSAERLPLSHVQPDTGRVIRTSAGPDGPGRTAAGETPAPVDPSFVLARGVRARPDFPREPEIVACAGGRVRAGMRYVVGISPRLLVAGQRDVEITVKLARRGFNFTFSASSGDGVSLRAPDPRSDDVLLADVRASGRVLVGVVPEVTDDMVGWKNLVVTVGGRESQPIPYALRVVRRVRLALTFDDGPSVEPFRMLGKNAEGAWRTPTETVLDVLDREGIKAVFFVLTSPDRFLFKTHPKAETPEGFALLRRAAREGHVLAVHWGGRYERQLRLHTSSLGLPAYDFDGDGTVDKVTGVGNALESDLLQCAACIRQAQAAEGITGHTPEFVRPPVWAYGRGRRDARPTYERLGLKMIFTDAKLYDGGYSFCGFTLDSYLIADIRKAMTQGHRDIVLTMHDSNPYTARDLEDVLREVREFMAREGLTEGAQWEFVGDTRRMQEILRGKQAYVRLPAES